MKLKKLELENFRCFPKYAVEFGGHYTDIYGANGVGKTTIANAVCWLLIDRPATEETDFTPKTGAAKGLHHGASITVIGDNGEEICFKKDFYEKYTKKKGAAEAEYTGNVIDYYINGVKSKKKDYTDAVERACHIVQDKMKILMVLHHFTDIMKTEDKRKILFEMATDYTDEDIFAAKPKLADLREYLKIPGVSGKLYTTVEYLSIAKEQRKKLNKDLELLPVRIDELAKSDTKDGDEAELNGKIAAGEKKIDALKDEKKRALSPAGQDAEKAKAIAEVERKIAEKQRDFLKEDTENRRLIQAGITETNGKIYDLQNQFAAAKNRQERCENQKAELTAMREKLLTEYAATMQEKWDAGMEICPTCGQALPPDKAESLRAEFNRKKSEKLTDINRRGQACNKAKIAELEAEINTRAADMQTIETQMKEAGARLANLKESLAKLPIFESTDVYKDLATQLDVMKRQQDLPFDENTAKTINEEYDAKINAVTEEVNAYRMEVAGIMAAKQNKARIAELEQQLKNTAADLEHIERGIYLAEEFNRTKANLISDSINSHFNKVKFILFREQINGCMREVCEPTCKDSTGRITEYRSLNYAEQINVQIDIVTALAKHYGVNLPVIMDQGESVINPAETEGQRIRLIVSAADKAIRVETKE